MIYLKDAPCAKGQSRACTLIAATTAGLRYLPIQMTAKQPLRELIIMLGHELQHATEIGRDARVVDAGTLYDLYRRIGFAASTVQDVFETTEARRTATTIRGELNRAGQ
jgi:hypothetical protein